MNKLISQAFIASGLLVYGGLALAAKLDYVNVAKGDGINPNDGKVFINPVNGNYGTATKSTTTYHMRMKAGCKRSNTLKQTFIAFGHENASGEVIEFSDNYRKGVNANLAKAIPWKDVVMNVPLTKLGFNPAAMCQSYLNSKVSQGFSKQQVLNSQHIINKQVTFSAVAKCGTSSSKFEYGTAKMQGNLEIICKAGSVGGIGGIKAQPSKPPVGGNNILTPGNAPKPQGSFQAPYKVNYVSFKPTPKTLNTTCPTKTKFTGKIGVSGPGQVKYRVVFPGNESVNTGVRTMNFIQASQKSIGNVEFPTSKSLQNAKAVLEVISPQQKKVFTTFSVNCIAAGGPNTIKTKPAASSNEGTFVLQPPKRR